MTSNAFVSLDVETANTDLSSICQIGVVTFENNVVVDTWVTLVNPDDEFDEFNIEIHGISEDDVIDAPTFPTIATRLDQLIAGRIVVSHTGFDRAALSRSYAKHGLSIPECHWLDSARVSRRAWSQFKKKGYGLVNLAEWCGITFSHHDACEDARVAGLVLVKAIDDTGISLSEWLDRIRRPIAQNARDRHTRTGDPDGPLFGEKVVFTGALSMSRKEAADYAAAAGCDVSNSVRSDTTIVVIGKHDPRKMAVGKDKSSKHRKAESLVRAGQPIRIISESDFKDMVL